MVVGGARVGLATLHNEDQVRAKDVRPGDTVVVRRAGDVIPEVHGPVLPLRPKDLPEWSFPTTCPICGTPLQRLEGEADTYCINVDCPGQQVQRISHFASRGAMDIEGLGERTVSLFCREGLLSDVADIYSLDFDRVQGYEGFGALSVANLAGAITASKSRPAGQPAGRPVHPPPRHQRQPGTGPVHGQPGPDHGRPRGRDGCHRRHWPGNCRQHRPVLFSAP